MRAVILAAGSSTRLRPFTECLPKGLLPVAGRPMLERSIQNLLDHSITELTVVTGFHADKLRTAIGQWFPELAVTYLHNEVYASTNNAYSLLIAKQRVAGKPFLLLDSDIVYDGEIVARVLAAGETCLALRQSATLGAEEVKAEVDPRGRVVAIGKEVPLEVAAGESIGIEWFSAEASGALFEILEHRMLTLGLVGEYYEATFQEMVDRKLAIAAVDIAPHYASEVDTPEDLDAVEATLRKKEAALRSPAIAASAPPAAKPVIPA